jgi:hypothetical protein
VEGDVKLSCLCKFVDDERDVCVGFICYIPDSVHVKCVFEALAKCIFHRCLLRVTGSGVVEPVGVGGPGGGLQDK